MQFIVDITPNFPHDWSSEKLAEMLRLETEAAMALMDQGVLLRIDRVVGRGGNISLWEADSPEKLDAAIQSLPMAPYIRVQVTPIMKHRVQIAYEQRSTQRGSTRSPHGGTDRPASSFDTSHRTGPPQGRHA